MASQRIAVDLFCDFDGVICPIAKLRHDEEDEAPSIDTSNTYPIDRSGKINTKWSSELAGNLRYLIDQHLVRWHWLTSNWPIIGFINDLLRFDSSQTVTEELWTIDSSTHIRLVAGGKAGIIKRCIISNANRPNKRAVAWIDDDYSSDDAEVQQLTDLAEQNGIPFLLITPNCETGLNRLDMYKLCQFIDSSIKWANRQ